MGKAQKLKSERRDQRAQAAQTAGERKSRKRLLGALALFVIAATIAIPAAYKAVGKPKLPDLTKETAMSTDSPTPNPQTTPGAAAPASAAQSTAVIQTPKGTITVALNREKAPKTVAQITTLISKGFYNNLNFHRVVPGFVVQGGDPKGDGSGKSDLPNLPFETNDLKHEKGVISMARSQAKDSANSQFYITLDAQPSLDGEYVVFGKVTSGMDVVEKIAQDDKINSITLK